MIISLRQRGVGFVDVQSCCTNRSPGEAVTVRAHFAGVSVLFADHDAERGPGDVGPVQTHVDVVHPVLSRDEANCVAICRAKQQHKPSTKLRL